MKTKRILRATALVAAAGLLGAYSTTSQAQTQKSESTRPMMQQQMKDHMSSKDMASGKGEAKDMQAMRESMMKKMRECMSGKNENAKMGMAGKKGDSQGMMNQEKTRDQMMQQTKGCMDRMNMKNGKDSGKQEGNPHQHGKKQN